MPERETYDVIVEEGVWVPMRDGVRLAADVYRPARRGRAVSEKLPALLERTPYGKGDPDRRRRCRYFASHGYVVVAQDCRGCYGSEGELYFLAQEPNDGYDTVEWMARQSWCNGKVGTYGTSYMAWTQSALATQAPPHLACMFPNMGGWNAHSNTVRHNGAFEMRFMAWAYWHSAINPNAALKRDPWVDQALNDTDFRDWLTRLPPRPGQTPLRLAPNYERWMLDIYTRGDYDDFWKQAGFDIERHLAQHSDVPIFLTGGWYDSYTRATLDAYMALKKAKQGPVRVMMGPWTHGTYTTEEPFSGNVSLGPDAALDSFDDLHLRWFDRWLKGIETGIDGEAPVRIFVMGGGSGEMDDAGRLVHGGRWRDEQEWPLRRARATPFYLHSDGALLTERPAESKSSTTYQYDPSRPVPTIGGNFSSLAYLKPPPAGIALEDLEYVYSPLRRETITPAGGHDQWEGPQHYGCDAPCLPLSSRPDVLVFQTPPLERDTEVTGPLSVTLWVSSSAPDTDFTAKLVDVYPPSADYPEGYALNISDSIVRMRYHRSGERAELLEPGRVYEVTITLYPTSNLFVKGHRIRLDVSSSNFPRFDANPNTGEPLGRHRRTQVAENTVYHDRSRPSHVVLPIVPTGRGARG